MTWRFWDDDGKIHAQQSSTEPWIWGDELDLGCGEVRVLTAVRSPCTVQMGGSDVGRGLCTDVWVGNASRPREPRSSSLMSVCSKWTATSSTKSVSLFSVCLELGH